MERQHSKNWKYVHHNRRDSDSMDVSVESASSNKSLKFNRFQFRREDSSILTSRDPKKESIFNFSAKGKEKNAEYSMLGKRSAKEKDKESDISKASDNDMILKGIGKEAKAPANISTQRQKDAATHSRQIARNLRGMTEQFKKIIVQFSKRYKQMRYQWDRTFKNILSVQVAQENASLSDLKAKLEKKSQQLQQLSRISFQHISQASAIKLPETNRQINEQQHSLSKLAISKVEIYREKENLQTLSRNNTIADILASASAAQKQERGVPSQIRALRKTMRRMQEILQE